MIVCPPRKQCGYRKWPGGWMPENNEGRTRLTYLRQRTTELQMEFAHIRAEYRAGKMERGEALPALHAIAYDMRTVAAEMRTLVALRS